MANLEKEELDGMVVIQFSNYYNRLLFLSFLDREKYYEFSINAPFREVLNVLKDEWAQEPFLTLIIQNPETIDSILRKYHEYNLLPIPPEPLIKNKIKLAEKFHRYINNKYSSLFRGSQLCEVNPSIEDFIKDASTGELLPPLGLMDLSEIAPSDRAYVIMVTTVKWINFSKAEIISPKEIMRDYPVHKIRCECCDESISCPVCTRLNLLRGWRLKDRTIALCYNCGILFFTDNDEIIAEFEGKREFWGARAIAVVGSLHNM